MSTSPKKLRARVSLESLEGRQLLDAGLFRGMILDYVPMDSFREAPLMGAGAWSDPEQLVGSLNFTRATGNPDTADLIGFSWDLRPGAVIGAATEVLQKEGRDVFTTVATEADEVMGKAL